MKEIQINLHVDDTLYTEVDSLTEKEKFDLEIIVITAINKALTNIQKKRYKDGVNMLSDAIKSSQKKSLKIKKLK